MKPKSRFAAGALEHAAQYLREGIRKGRWEAGDALEATALAAELGISASPVREAFARLHGEGILETRHRDGYSVPLLQQHQVEGEYRFIGLLATSLATRVQSAGPARQSPSELYQDRVGDLLAAIALAADLPAAAATLRHYALRLASYIRAEPLFMPHSDQHIAEMASLLEAGDAMELTSMLERHYASCIHALPSIARHVFETAKRSGKDVE